MNPKQTPLIPQTTRDRLAELAMMVTIIRREQRDHPGYMAGVMRQIVDSELEMLERETLAAGI